MDNTNLNNQTPPTTPVPPTPPAPPVNNTNSQPAVFQLDSLTKNQKFMETVKIFAIYGTIISVVRWIVSSLSASFFGTYYSYSSFNLAVIIPMVIYAVIFSVISGVIFYFIFNYVRDFIKGSVFLSKHIYSLFTLFWIPTLVFSVLTAIFAILPVLALIFLSGGLFIGIVISFVANLVLYYFYAKTVSAKLQSYYPW